METRCVAGIVDDEQIIRDGLRRVVPWEAHGFEVGADFASAAEVEHYPASRPLDLLVVDVCMPGVSGLELIRALRSVRPETRFVIVSGYDSFDYAREAIDLGVIGYLLKPVRVEQLVSLLDRARDAILAERQRARVSTSSPARTVGAMLEAGNALEWGDPLLTGIAGWLGRPPSAIAYFEILPAVRPDGVNAYGVASFESTRSVVESLVGLSNEARIVIPLFARSAVITILRNPHELSRITRDVAKTCRRLFADGPRPSWAGAVLHMDHGALSGRLLNRLARICSARWWLGNETVHDADQLERIDRRFADHTAVSPIVLPEHARRLAQAIVSGDGATTEAAVHDLIDDLRAAGRTDADALAGLIIALSGLLGAQLTERGVDPELIDLDGAARIGRTIAGYTFDTLEDRLTDVLTHAASRCRERVSRPHNHTINAALTEISRRYGENIGLGDVAESVGVTPSHLSRLFRNVLDRSFKEYLTMVRINEAKRRLLTTNDRIYEIASHVGFREQRYFSEVFRKQTGCAPLQFRNRGAATPREPKA